jgi:CheY-like chemotaxis protein
MRACCSTGMPGQGALFRVEIPVDRATVDEVAGDTQMCTRCVVEGLAPGQPGWRILVAEDDDVNRQLLTGLLEPVGFEVRCAENGKQAVDQFEQWRPHLVWMDMRMPVMDGYEATRQIKANHSEDAPIILALTANAFEEERLVALSLGCDDFIRKPFQATVILEKMAEFLDIRYIYAHSTVSSSNGQSALPEDASPIQADSDPLVSRALSQPPSEDPNEQSTEQSTGQSTGQSMEQSMSERIPSGQVTSMTNPPLRILAAEDNVLNQKLICKMLEQLGHRVTTVGHGEEVLDALQRQSYDVVLMDVQMPQMDGLAATKHIRQQGTSADDPYIIAMTGHVSDEDKDACFNAGMNAYLTKPIRFNALADVLERCQLPRAFQEPSLEPEPLDTEILNQIPSDDGEGTDSFLRMLIETYFEDATHYLSKLDQAIAHQDINTVRSSAHSLKSMSASLGSTDFARLCQTVEDMKAIADFPDPSHLSDQLHQAYARFHLALKQVYEQSRHSRIN